MKHRRFLLSLAAAMLLAAAPRAFAQEQIGSNRIESHLQYRGFGIFRWTNPAWTVLRAEQVPILARIRRVPLSVTHTAFIEVRLNKLTRPPKSAAEFAALVDKRSGGLNDPVRHRILSVRQKPENYRGRWANRYEVRLEDRNAPNSPLRPLILRNTGLIVLHPAFPATVITIEFSERGLPSEVGKKPLEAEANDIIRRVQLETAPNRPL